MDGVPSGSCYSPVVFANQNVSYQGVNFLMLDNHAPRTMMILGAALSGGDALKLAKQMVKQDETKPIKTTEDVGDTLQDIEQSSL